MHVLVTCKYKKDRIKKQPRKAGDTVFPIINQWGLSVAMETRVLIQSAPKPVADLEGVRGGVNRTPS